MGCTSHVMSCNHHVQGEGEGSHQTISCCCCLCIQHLLLFILMRYIQAVLLHSTMERKVCKYIHIVKAYVTPGGGRNSASPLASLLAVTGLSSRTEYSTVRIRLHSSFSPKQSGVSLSRQCVKTDTAHTYR
ncbi:hypothetical protein FKM82_008037 [Ascaphus truei]